jgi:hypothetical protein
MKQNIVSIAGPVATENFNGNVVIAVKKKKSYKKKDENKV